MRSRQGSWDRGQVYRIVSLGHARARISQDCVRVLADCLIEFGMAAPELKARLLLFGIKLDQASVFVAAFPEH